MLENIDLTKKLDRETYKGTMDDLSERLYFAQRKSWEAGIPVVILFEGWDAAGKGTTIHKLTDPIDPRGYKIYPIRASRTYEKKRPWLWRFWLKIPARGEWAIFDRSWYGRVLVERMLKLTPKDEWQRAYRDIVDFEHALADDGTLILKFFLHISKKEQGKRFRKLEADPLNAWRVTSEDWNNHKRYRKWLRVYEEMLERTDSEWAPWTIVEATDKRYTRVKVYQTIIDALEERLGIRTSVERPAPAPAGEPAPQTPVPGDPAAATAAQVQPEESPNHLEIIEQALPEVKESPLEVAEKADKGLSVDNGLSVDKGLSADKGLSGNKAAPDEKIPAEDQKTAEAVSTPGAGGQPPEQAVPEESQVEARPEPAPEPEEPDSPSAVDDNEPDTEDDHAG